MKAAFIEQVSLSTGETLEVFRSPCGGVFAIDSSFIEQVLLDSDNETVIEPFNNKPVELELN